MRRGSDDTDFSSDERDDLVVSSLHRKSAVNTDHNVEIGNLKETLQNQWNDTKEWAMSPFLNEVRSQWMLAIIWALVTLISLGVVWHPEAHTHWDGTGCTESAGRADMLVLLCILHFIILVFCGWRLHKEDGDSLENIWIPYVGLYGVSSATQVLFKMMILLTSGLGIAAGLRTYYLLSHDDNGFTEESGFTFMLSVCLLAYVGIFQLEPESIQRLYYNADIDMRFWKGGVVTSQFLQMLATLVVFGISIVHMARYKPPGSCIDGTDQGRWTLFVFTLASAGTTIASFIYIFIRPKKPKNYDVVDKLMRNLLGIASHLVYMCFFIYILLYYAMGLSVSNLNMVI